MRQHNKREAHPNAGQTITIQHGSMKGKELRLEDWWVNVAGVEWGDAVGNPAAMMYAMRSARDRLPIDNNVVYGKVGAFGHLVHVSELGL